VKELAAELRMSVKSIQRGYRKGDIPVQWMCRMARFDLAKVRRAMVKKAQAMPWTPTRDGRDAGWSGWSVRWRARSARLAERAERAGRAKREQNSTFYPYPHLARRLVWSPLRASSDHWFIVGALRAQRSCQSPRHPLACSFFSSQAGWLILESARRRTVTRDGRDWREGRET